MGERSRTGETDDARARSRRAGPAFREVPPELRDREVSARALQPLWEAVRARGVDPARLAEGTGYSVAHLTDPRARISWAAFVRFMRNLGETLDDGGLVALGAEALQSPFFRALLLPGRLLFSVPEVYLWMFSADGPASSLFVTYEGRIEQVGAGRLRFESRMKPGYAASRENYLVMQGSLMGLSKALGAGPAEVTYDPLPDGALFDIRVPAGGGALAAARRGLDWVLAARSTAEELRLANAEIHRRYVELQREVDARKQAEAELRRLNEELERRVAERTAALEAEVAERESMRAALARSEKLASLGMLSAGIAHEINNPMAFVSNNLHVLEGYAGALMGLVDVYEGARASLARVDPGAAARAQAIADEADLPYVRENLLRLIARTREGVQRVTRIVEDLQSLARTDRPELVPTNLRALADASVDALRARLARRGIDVEVDWDPDAVAPVVPTLMAQALNNLLTNAAYAVEAARPAGGGRIRVEGRRQGAEQVIEVTDNGAGVAPEALPRLFDPFYTTKPTGEGMGLGLAITHSIVVSHGGRIEVENLPGGGARFRVHLPLEPGRATLWPRARGPG